MVKQKSLEDSSKLLDRALAQKSSVSGHAKARMLQSFLPSFSDRVNGMDPSDASRRYTNKSLGELLLWRYESRVADNAGWSSEALVFYLMSREGIPSEDLLFIGSPREETNVAHARLNHDAYRLWPDGSGDPAKFPLQIKTTSKNSSQYDVPTLAVVPTLRPVLETLGTDSIEPIMAMAAFEAIGKTGFYQETTLDFASHCLQSAITTLTYRHIMGEMAQSN